MGLGLRHRVSILRPQQTTDEAGFGHFEPVEVGTVRAYRERKHGSEAWANRAGYSQSTVLFRFRVLPNLAITSDMELKDFEGHYTIDSVEVIQGRYVEVLATDRTASGSDTASPYVLYKE